MHKSPGGHVSVQFSSILILVQEGWREAQDPNFSQTLRLDQCYWYKKHALDHKGLYEIILFLKLGISTFLKASEIICSGYVSRTVIFLICILGKSC